MGKQSSAGWLREHYRPTDGPDSGKRLRLEPWQRGFLKVVDRERKTILPLRAASQVGKTLIALGVGVKSAHDGRGVLMVSATEVSVRDLSRRLETTLRGSPALSAAFPEPRAGPGARSSWKDRRLDNGGWLAMAAAGSASQLASRTAQAAVADEVSRWPSKVRSGEGHPFSLLRARIEDWGDRARLIAISSPVLKNDKICMLHDDGDRRRMEYPCTECGELTPFLWEHVTGRGRDDVPKIACVRCGAGHDDRARRQMLARGQWVAQVAEPTDEDTASFSLSRIDSRRATLARITREWRRAERDVARGDTEALKVFANVVLGRPGSSGAADVDKLLESREETYDLGGLEQVAGGVDIQNDRLVFAVLGFGRSNLDVWTLAVGDCIGDPRSDGVWTRLDAILQQRFGGMRISVVGLDAGFLTSDVQRQCGTRRWWIPTIGRSGPGKPIARPMSKGGLCTLGKDDASAWWSGRVVSGSVHLPATMDRRQVSELCAAEALCAIGGALRWRPIEGRQNHLWDCGILAVFARHYRTIARNRQPPRRLRIA